VDMRTVRLWAVFLSSGDGDVRDRIHCGQPYTAVDS
jgi:hypothetical protein